MSRWGGGSTAEETKAQKLELLRVSDKKKTLFAQLKKLTNPQTERKRCKTTEGWHLNNPNSERKKEQRKGEKWTSGNRPSLTNCEGVSEQLSTACKLQLKVQGGARAVSMSAQQYLCIHSLINKAQSAHTSSFTDKQQQQSTPGIWILAVQPWHRSNNWEKHRKSQHSFGWLTLCKSAAF